MKLLLLGHRQCGKTTIGKMIADKLGLVAHDSSWYAAENIVYPVLKERYGYKDAVACYEDRGNHRQEWFDLIREFNAEPDSLTKDILANGDIYVGMRSQWEFDGSRHHFDRILWIEGGDRVPPEAKESMELSWTNAMDILDNSGDEADLEANVDSYIQTLIDARLIEDTRTQ